MGQNILYIQYKLLSNKVKSSFFVEEIFDLKPILLYICLRSLVNF